jgi:hypothetical protein
VYWNDRGAPTQVRGTLTVAAQGEEIASTQVDLRAEGDAVQVGGIDWPTLVWTADGTPTTHDALGGPPFNQ